MTESRDRSQDPWSGVLNASDPGEFWPAISTLLASHSLAGPNIAELPELIRMTRVLWALDWDVRKLGDGIHRFLGEQVEGAFLADAARWCAMIGATEAAAYIQAAVAALPDRRVPSDWAARLPLCSRLERLAGDLDRTHRGAVDEVWVRLRDHLRAHRDDLAASLSFQPHIPTLEEVLDVADATEFFDAVHNYMRPPGSRMPESPQQPELFRVVLSLRALYIVLGGNGIAAYLEDYISDYFDEAVAWCMRIGAERTTAFLQRAAGLFPGGVVPSDQGERSRIKDQLAEQKPDPLRGLDKEYSGAVEELPELFRTYLRAHPAEVLAAVLPATAE